jgi:hypothetical protein
MLHALAVAFFGVVAFVGGVLGFGEGPGAAQVAAAAAAADVPIIAAMTQNDTSSPAPPAPVIASTGRVLGEATIGDLALLSQFATLLRSFQTYLSSPAANSNSYTPPRFSYVPETNGSVIGTVPANTALASPAITGGTISAASSGSFDALSAGTLSLTGALTGTGATFSGTLTAGTLSVSSTTATSTFAGAVGVGTTTPGSLLSLGGIANFTAATSTFYAAGGINLAAGCFAVAGSCIGSGSGSAWPFTSSTNFGIAVQATTTPAWFQSGLMASSSVRIDNTIVATTSELVTNGTFTGGTTGWTLGSDVAYGTNNAVSTHAGGDASLNTTFDTVSGKTYRISYTVSNANGPNYFYLANNTGYYDPPTLNGAHVFFFTANFTGTETITFDDWNGIVGDTWRLDDVSIKQVNALTPSLQVIGTDGKKELSFGEGMFGNLAIGSSALYANTTGVDNTAIGHNALRSNTSGSENVTFGSSALHSNTTGYDNAAIGYRSLYMNTTGAGNAAIGPIALEFNTTGRENVAIGSTALRFNTIGSDNTVIGPGALRSNTTGSSNVGIGSSALFYNESATNTVAIGYAAGLGPSPYNSQGATIIGFSAGRSFGTGSDYNTLLGYNSGFGITTGARNVLLGHSTITASYNQVTTGSNNIAIGNDVAIASSTLSNQLVIGNLIYGTGLSGTGSTVSAGNIGIGTTSPTSQLHTTGTVRFSNFGAGTLTTDASGNLSVSSDERLKDINGEFNRGLSEIVKLVPINYHWNTASGLDTMTQYAGFSAQNVQDAIPEAVGSSTNGYLSLSDRPILAALVNAVKEIAARLDGFARQMVSDRVVANDQLCIGSTCVTEQQLQALLAAAPQADPDSSTPPSSSPAVTPPPSPATTSPAIKQVDETTPATPAPPPDLETPAPPADISDEDRPTDNPQQDIETDTSTEGDQTI